MASSASTSTLVNDFDGFNATLQKALLSTTRAANGIPGPSDLQFQRTLSRPTGRKVDDVSKRLLHLTEQMLSLAREGTHSLMSTKDAKGKGKETHRKPAKKARELREEDLIDGYSKHVVEITDHLLELMDTNLDEHRKMLVQQAAAALSSSSAGSALPQPGAAEQPAAGTSASPFATVPTTSASYAGSANKGRLPKEILNSVDTAKPQLLFDNPLDNARHAVFTPILPSKVHARVPLSLEAVPYTDTETGENRLRIPNPYEQEIMESLKMTLPSEPPAEGMDVDDAPQSKMDSRMHEKPFTFVDTLDKLDECLQKLKLAKVIAIDLEHHDYRSYRGFTSLVQISTTLDDFIVDPLVPAIRSTLHTLNEVFADPGIVKVLHGAESDIIWLQRDFGLYVVNLFDTYHASKVLERTTGNGLASLLQEYTTFAVDKRYQLADWRIRPLPQEMLLYARSDTHFLLFIYQQLLHHRDMTPERIAEIRRRSAVTASQAYEHVLYDAGNGTGYGGWRGLIERAGKGPMWGLVDERTARDGLAPAISWINTKGIVSLHVFKAVHDWRDALARELDESPRYLLSNKVIFSLAEYPPRTAQALEGAMGGETKPPVKERLEELLAVITPAVARGEQEADRQRQEQADAGVPSGHGAHDEAAPPGFGPASSLLWKATAAAPSAVTSSLFNGQRGGGQGSSGTTPNISASASSLFDSLFAAPSSRSTPPSSGISKFSSVLQRVHSAMLDQLKAVHLSTESEDAATTSNGQQGESAPGSPRIKIQQDVMDQDDTAQQGGSSITMLDPNHTFVSNVARTSTSKAAKKEEESDLDDEIVSVSAKSKGRKRKHPKEDATSGNSSSKKAAKKEEADEPVVPFDYSKAKSVLDAPAQQPAAGVPKAKKPKKDKKGGIIEDGFKAAPKSMSAPKAGNKSYTFTKG